MADFCGLTRVKTWRWSRLFACALAVFCAISPAKVFAVNTSGAYSCPSMRVTCNPGFYLVDNVCEKCPQVGNSTAYKILKDTGVGSDAFPSCKVCPTNGTCPEIVVDSYSYGYPTVLCDAGYYREYTSDGKGLQCSSCDSKFTGSYKNADSITDLGFSITAGSPLVVQDNKVAFASGYLGADQCKLCKTDYYQRGYYTSSNPSNDYTGANRCSSCSSASTGNGSLVGCTTDGVILCGANHYRQIQSDGSVKCVSCGSAYNKPADTNASDKRTGIEQCYRHCASNAYITARTDNDGDLVGECALISTINTSNSSAYMVEGGETYDKIVCKHGYYPTVNIFVDKSNDDYGKVRCVACPTGLTTNDYDQDGEPEGTTVGNGGYWAVEADAWNAYCVNCAEGWFLVPNPTRCYSDQSPLSRKVCLKCPTTNTSNVVACGGLNYAGQNNLSADAFSGIYGKDKGYLLCKKGYYADWQKTYTDGNSYCNTSGGTPRTSEAYCSRCDNGASSATDQSYPSQWWDNSWIPAYTNSYPDITQGSDQCNSCKSGYFVLSGSASETNCYKCPSNTVNNDNKCSTGKVNCKANYYLVDNGGTPNSGASYYDNRFTCEACPAFTGKVADSNHSAFDVGLKQCNICADGYYGSSSVNNNFDRSKCESCPAFAKLNIMGICVRGHTLKPTSTDSSFSNTRGMCSVRNSAVGSSYKLPTETTESTYQPEPEFTDTTGTFVFSIDFHQEMNACPLKIPTYGLDKMSGVCTLDAGQHCVYVDMDISNSNKLNNPDACVAAIMWQAKVNNDGDYAISPGTAEDIMHHWGIGNPWFCTEDADAADKFKRCLNGESGAPDGCPTVSGAACTTNTGLAKTCVVGTDTGCGVYQ